MGILSRFFSQDKKTMTEFEYLDAEETRAFLQRMHDGREGVLRELQRSDDGQYYYCGICGWVHISRFPHCH
jgi:hypothetical protein